MCLSGPRNYLFASIRCSTSRVVVSGFDGFFVPRQCAADSKSARARIVHYSYSAQAGPGWMRPTTSTRTCSRAVLIFVRPSPPPITCTRPTCPTKPKDGPDSAETKSGMTSEENTICGGRRDARRKTEPDTVSSIDVAPVIRCWRSWLGRGGGGLDRACETGGQRLLPVVLQTNVTALEIGS